MIEDLGVFFGPPFAEKVLVSGGGSFPVIVQAPFVGVGEVAAVESAAISLECKSADVSKFSVKHGTALTLNAEAYIVRGIEPDGTGVTVLRLEKP